MKKLSLDVEERSEVVELLLPFVEGCAAVGASSSGSKEDDEDLEACSWGLLLGE
jgi:hypothetical protein